MRHIKLITIFVVLALALAGCGVFGGDDGGDDLSAADTPTAVPTANFVQPQQPAFDAEEGDGDAIPVEDAPATLPTAVTLPVAEEEPAAPVDRSQPTTYVVQSGDVLGIVAERFEVDIAELRRVNGLSGNLIRVGQELTIPALTSGDTTDTGSDETAQPAPAATAVPAPTTPPEPVSCPAGSSGHCVQPGDSLLGIATEYGVSVDSLRSANPSLSGDLIQIGQLLTIPGASSDPAPAATSVPSDGGSTDGGSTPVATTGPLTDADCLARNPEFPYFHAADGLCYANPIGGATAVPTSTNAEEDIVCPPGRFLWEDGLCYPVPGATVTVDPSATVNVVATVAPEDYGRPPCRDGYVVIVATNRCWPEAENTSPATVTPVATATPEPTSTPTS